MREKEKILLSVKVQPRARKPGVERLSNREYKVRVLASPSKGEANREVIETLAAHFNLPSSRIKIVRGQKSRNKLVLIDVDRSK